MSQPKIPKTPVHHEAMAPPLAYANGNGTSHAPPLSDHPTPEETQAALDALEAERPGADWTPGPDAADPTRRAADALAELQALLTRLRTEGARISTEHPTRFAGMLQRAIVLIARRPRTEHLTLVPLVAKSFHVSLPTFRDLVDDQVKADRQQARGTAPSPSEPEHFSDWGNAQRLVRHYGHLLRYNKALGWLMYQGQRWVRDRTGEVERCAKDVVRELYAEGSREPNEDRRKTLVHHALKSESAKALRDMVQVATSEDAVIVTPEQLDANRWVLNTPTGTLDLRTGTLHPHRPEDLLTKLARVPYDPAATCPRFLAFLDQIFGGDAELIGFVQRLGGCCLTGAVERIIIICWGSGDNGKTTLLEILRGVLGDYALTTPMTTLMAKRDGGGIPNDVARFPGARLITAAESEKGQRFAQSLIKYLTGGDRQIARYLFKEYFEFDPTYKLVIITNNKPEVDATDQAFWNRVRLLPFTQVIPKAAQVERYHDVLVAEEGPGILNWLVAGCAAYQAAGLGVPAAVREATTTYRHEADRLRDFVADCCDLAPDAWVASGDLYAVYKAWCTRGNEVPMSQTAFGVDLTAHKFAEARLGKKRQRVRTGLRLTTSWQAWADGARLRTGGEDGRRWTA